MSIEIATEQSVALATIPRVDVKGRSTIEFPYSDLDSAIEVVRAVHNVGGTGCEWVQLAVHMKHSPKGGGFRMRVMTARSFSLLDYDRGNVTLTDLGIRCMDPRHERAARVEAFLAVPAFKQMYERLKGNLLPPPAALERMFVEIGVTPKQKDKVRLVFLRSATQAGFRDADQERLVAPNTSMNTQGFGANEKDAEEESRQTNGRDLHAANYHPFIEGLLKTLPDPETEWSIAGRVKWLQTASNIFGLIYTAKEEDESAIIDITKKAL